MQSNNPKSTPPTLKQTTWLFLGGAAAGAVIALFGGLWQVNHFWWMAGDRHDNFVWFISGYFPSKF
jgi:hypothetical protein